MLSLVCPFSVLCLSVLRLSVFCPSSAVCSRLYSTVNAGRWKGLRLNIRDEIFDDLQSSGPFAEVKTGERSKSQLYEAIRQYLDEVEVSLEARARKTDRSQRPKLKFEGVTEVRGGWDTHRAR